MVKPYHQTGEDNFPSRNNSQNPQDILAFEDLPVLVKKIIKARKIRINWNDHGQYLVRFKKLTSDKAKWLNKREYQMVTFTLRDSEPL
ncbi:hypothetical protein O181_107947 [Austropuccinia psidii MF-1]|uniref:Uncharacterized protein n=1 Tax=Austropuccinia psidii MF-1 TaxID=1389203 RepID=A0A9Q3JV04_9BASI|nr:hypothetical protein [Austropuccinia psidii MF-1]